MKGDKREKEGVCICATPCKCTINVDFAIFL